MLEVLREERLQEAALATGQHLRAGLQRLQAGSATGPLTLSFHPIQRCSHCITMPAMNARTRGI